MAGSVQTACRVFTGLIGVAIAAAAYSVASVKVVLIGCNITEILPTDDDGCFVARGEAEGHGTILLEVGSACLTEGALWERDGRCYEGLDRVFLGDPGDHTGTVVLLGLLSTVCILVAVCVVEADMGGQNRRSRLV